MINIKSIWENQKPTGDIIIKTRIDEIEHLNCFAATNHITGQHLYIMSISKNVAIPELKNYRFRGVEIFTVEIENKIELYIYLLDNELKDIFSLFIINILEDIRQSITENEALTTTLNIVSKWKKLFDKIRFTGLTIEEQKGLIGELLFMCYLLDNDIPVKNIFSAWTGADYNDKDFLFGSVGIEIKHTSSKHPVIRITSERQLDAENLSELFLVVYTSEEVKQNGFSLNSLIDDVRKKLKATEDINFFNERLLLIGYHEEDREHYAKLYASRQNLAYNVTEHFPKITSNHIQHGIFNTSYNIEMSAVVNFIFEMTDILKKIQLWTEN